jgi:hypothetical protein
LLLGQVALWAGEPQEATAAANIPEDDDVLAKPEIGAETTGIVWWDRSARNLYYSLGRAGWTKRFLHTGRWAWEEDFKVSWRGGKEHYYVDTVDLAFFHGRAGSSYDSLFRRYLRGPYFGAGHRHDDPWLVPGDAYRAWGDSDLEWMAIKGCKVLDDTSRRYWASTMDRLHLIMGFKTNSYSTRWGKFGSRLARYIRWGYTFPQAWFRAIDDTQPHHRVVARILAEERCHLYDRWYRTCGDRYPNGWYWYWDHRAGSEPARTVDPGQLDYQMPVYSIQPDYLVTDELDKLSGAFGLSGTPVVLDQESQLYRISSGALDLTADQQGLYTFIDRDRLWTVTGTTTSDLRVLSEGDD